MKLLYQEPDEATRRKRGFDSDRGPHGVLRMNMPNGDEGAGDYIEDIRRVKADGNYLLKITIPTGTLSFASER